MKKAWEVDPSEGKKLERGCRALRYRVQDKKIADLTVKETEMMTLCRAFGY